MNALNKFIDTLRKYFGGIHLTWPQVLIFAVVTGVYTGLINQVPFLADTSLTDIAVTWEVWLLFALFVACNTEKPLEAAVKVFVFFLVSQPIVYLVEWPTLGHFPWEYYRYWLFLTFLTFPAGFLAWHLRKQKVWTAIVLVCVLALAAGPGATYVGMVITNFPRHLLTALFCVAEVVFFALIFRESTRSRIACMGCGLMIMLFLTLMNIAPVGSVGVYEMRGDATWQIQECDSEEVTATIVYDENSETWTLQYTGIGTATITMVNADGETLTIDLTVVKSDTGGTMVSYECDGEEE